MKKLSNQNVFLKEVDSFFLRRAIFNLEDVYKKFFTKRNKSYWAHCIRDIDKGKKYSNITKTSCSKNKRLSDERFSILCLLLEWHSKIKREYYYKVSSYYPSNQLRMKEI